MSKYADSVAGWTIAANIQERMERQGRSRKWLADATGVSLSSINNYLSAFTEPSATKIYRIARALHCTVEDLVTDEDGWK